MWVLLGLWIDIFFLELKSRFINSVLLLGAVLWFFRKVLGKEGLKIQPTGTKYYVIALFAGALYPFLQTGLNVVYNLGFETEMWNPGFHPERLTNLNIVGAILLAPICEEFIFRRYIQDGLQKNYRPWIAVIVTSLLFGALHINFLAPLFDSLAFNFHDSYIAFFGGLIAGTLYLKSNSIGPPIVMHFMWNLVANLG